MSPSDHPAPVTVLHLDSYDRKKLLAHDPDEPTTLAPWSTWLRCRYIPLERVDHFVDRLHQTIGELIVLLHETDRPSVLQRFDLANRLSEEPACRLVLYSGSWRGWAACSRDEVLLSTGTTLPVALWQQRWSAMPWLDLIGQGRPLAWLPFRSLEQVHGPFADWQTGAVEWLISGLPLTEARDFDRQVRAVLLRDGLLVHSLNAENNRPLSPQRRLGAILQQGDSLWLLEGFARHRRWPAVADRLCRTRQALERLLGRPPSSEHLRDEDRPSWTPTIETIEDIANEPLGES